jgi:hypothetical protein
MFVIDNSCFNNDIEVTHSALSSELYDSSASTIDITNSLDNTRNAIHIIDKKSLIVIKTIKPSNWYDPVGLFIDSEMNIVTTAYSIYKKINLSNSRYLFTINQDGEILNRANLYFDEQLSDLNVVDKEKILLVSRKRGIFIYEFEKSDKFDFQVKAKI